MVESKTSARQYEEIRKLAKRIRQLAQKNDDDYLYEKCNLIIDHSNTEFERHFSKSLGLVSPKSK